MVRITKKFEEADLITHSGVFHGDEVFATVILSKLKGDVKVLRTFKVPESGLKPDAVVYDIGHGCFDHHQRGGNGVRANGVPYASAGLIWKEFGYQLLKDFKYIEAERIWHYVDSALIAGVDAMDNGALPFRDYPIQDMNVSRAITTFNPDWDSDETPDQAFMRAIAFAEVIFDNTFARAISEVKAKGLVEEAIASASEHIMVLDRFVPWQSHIYHSEMPEKAQEIWFVVFPSNRGGFNWQCVPEGNGSRAPRRSVPDAWCGLPQDKLREVTGVSTATFCHQAGFIGSAETLEDAILMAKLAIQS